MLLSADTSLLKTAFVAPQHVVGRARRPIAKGHQSWTLHSRRGKASFPVLCNSIQQQPNSGTVVTSEPTASQAVKLEVTLKGLEALQTVRLGLVPQGKGQAIVVTEVAEGSRAEELGVRRGQKLNALSDPMRYGTMWSLLERPSLRFVVDTFKMRRSSPIDLEFEPLMSADDMDAIFGSVGGASTGRQEEEAAAAGAEGSAAARAGAEASSSSSSNGAVDMSPDNALGSLSSIDQMLGSGSGSDAESETIGERLAAKHAAQQRARMAVNQVQKRIDRRKAYMEIDEQRDDTGLLLGLAAAFLVPPLVILTIAGFTGYLDRLYLTALTLR
ncbi:hypothetical protein PLESTB_000716300 [Pleodorina starrii]|uniref:PDZ domain-containing protein n=1 Tax=Pleodorina starrii TaxID=330485 RepID=A0A9W6F2A5_9CHLO|nr:hypothetical protein PLESTM_001711200 [Pleodorina starrii]GLC53175.1 hypothetical protein PLESTB_000716300 [Pleodorina starrii]GLC68630.1 hypothetical protein PLESTF_000716900 [Pleodorina starrii]